MFAGLSVWYCDQTGNLSKVVTPPSRLGRLGLAHAALQPAVAVADGWIDGWKS